ncbi:protein phosphatase 2C domain-containing protein [Streptomyces mutabilis]|uniref:protein phosphatase 2C domain-containing protein n=1 Tax=Streptomyces mutabilis TaxID=67332 RepID=UPI00398686AD
MSQQGGSPAGHDDDWWTQLYDDSADDTGPTTAPDSLDDRFASAAGTVARGPDHDLWDGPTPPPSPDRPPPADGQPRPAPPWWATSASAGVPAPRTGPPPPTDTAPRRPGPPPPRAPWEPPPAVPTGPANFPPTSTGREAGQPAPTGRETGQPVPPRPAAEPPGPEDPPGGRPSPARPMAESSGPAPHRTAAAGSPRPPADERSGGPARATDESTGPAQFPAKPSGAPQPPAGPPSGAPQFPIHPPSGAPQPPAGPPSRAPQPPVDAPSGSAQFPVDAPSGPPQPLADPPPASTQPPAGPPPDGNVASAAPVVPPKGGGRRVWLRGRTTSGTGDGDLSEPSAGGSAPVSGGFRPPPPAGAAPGLPPLPPPFLPYDPPEPAPGTVGSDRDYVGSGPPTYDAEPTALPPADPDGLDGLVADTVLDGARYGSCTLRAVSVRGDSARYRGDPRRDALLVARFGAGEQALVLVAMATGARATSGAHLAAAEVCRWIGRAVGRSHARLGEDLRAARRGDLKSGLHRLTDRSLGRLRAGAADQGLSPDEYAATLRCLLLPADPECRTRVYFGVGAGGLLRLRDGTWQNMEPSGGEVTGEPVVGFGSPPAETSEGDRLTMDLGVTTPPGPYHDPPPEPPREPFRFRASVARPGDVLLMCTAGLAEPLLNEPELGGLLARRWSGRPAPGLAEFLADSRVRVKGYADDRTAAAVWEA